jgi:hypothetical protein
MVFGRQSHPPQSAGGGNEVKAKKALIAVEGRAQMLALVGVLFLLGAAETAWEMADTEPGGSAASDLGYALAEALLEMYIMAGEALVMGGLLYLLSCLRGRRLTLLEALFNWAVVAAAAITALLMYVE